MLEDLMEVENNSYLDKLVLYLLAIICPFLALILVIVIGYRKNADVLLNRIKLISLYEIFEFFVIGISYIYWDKEGITVSIMVLFIFYLLVCGIVAHRKKDYVSRGISLGLFANHYSLAVMQTSEDSKARVDNSKWPDSGLAVILMVFKLLFILLLLFPVNSLIIKINSNKPEFVAELTESRMEESIPEKNIELSVIESTSFYALNIHFIANTNLFLSEGNQNVNIPPDMSEGSYLTILQKAATEMKRILNIKPDQLFVISGYTADIPGDKEDNIVVSSQRADRVRNILVDLGIPNDNMECFYMGGTSKWGNNLSEETKKPNRVVTIELKE
jgi:hypothetical protein